MSTYFKSNEAKIKDWREMRESQFKALLKIYIGLGDLVDIGRVDRDEPRNYIEALLELSGIDDISFWDWYLEHQGTWEEFVDAYCKEEN